MSICKVLFNIPRNFLNVKYNSVWLKEGIHCYCKIFSRDHDPPMDILINANAVPKLLEILLPASKPNARLFSWFYINHAFVILALICNLNLPRLSPTLHQVYLMSFCCCPLLDSSLCLAHLIQLWSNKMYWARHYEAFAPLW